MQKVWSFFVFMDYYCIDGVLAQLEERLVRNQKATGSNPVSSTIKLLKAGFPFIGNRFFVYAYDLI